MTWVLRLAHHHREGDREALMRNTMRQYRVLTGTIRGTTPAGATANVEAAGIVLLKDKWIRPGMVHPDHVQLVSPGTGRRAAAPAAPVEAKDYAAMSWKELKAEFDDDLVARFAAENDGKAHYRASKDDLAEFLTAIAADTE